MKRIGRKKLILILVGLFILSVIVFRQSNEEKFRKYLERTYDLPFEFLYQNDGDYHFRCLEYPYKKCTVYEHYRKDRGELIAPSFWGHEGGIYDNFSRPD